MKDTISRKHRRQLNDAVIEKMAADQAVAWLNYTGQGTPALLPIPEPPYNDCNDIPRSEVTSLCFTHNGIFSTDPETGESAFTVSGEILFDDSDFVITLT